MAQLNESYYVPSDIRWVDASKDISSSSITTSERAVVVEGGASKKLCWVCSHSNFQYQYRKRRRLSPAPAATAGREWEDWGEWQGNDLTSETRSAAERMEHISNTTITTDAEEFVFAYSFSNYDKIEYQVRVRTFNPHTYECSEWGYATLEVVYKPTANFGERSEAIRQANGEALLTVDTNWVRGGNRFTMKNVRRRINGNIVPTSTGTGMSKSNLEPDFTITVSRTIIGKADRIYADFGVLTSDGVAAKLDTDYFDIAEKGGNKPETIDPPVVSIEDADTAAIVSVTSSGGAYASVHVSASYVDALGKETLIEAVATEADGVWTAAIEAPPYDIPMTYRVAVTNADGWDYVEVAHVTKSKDQHSWTYGETFVALKFAAKKNSSFAVNGEVVDTAKDKPAARFGRGVTRTIDASGKMVNPALVDGPWKADIGKLAESHTWIYRAPGGERYKVMVLSVSESYSSRDVINVAVSMQEVE